MRKSFVSKTVVRECYASFVLNHGSLLSGAVVGFPSCLVPQLRQDGYGIDPLVQSVIGSVPVVMNAVSAFTVIFIIGKGGRKVIQQSLLATLIVSLSVMYFSTSLPVLICGLAVSASVICCITPLLVAYISETCQKERRGVLLASAFVSFTSGSAVMFILNSLLPWRGIVAVLILIGGCGFAQMFLLPETKYWHLMNGDIELAKGSMSWFQPRLSAAEIDRQIAIMRQSLESRDNSANGNFFQLFRYLKNREILKPLLVGILINFFRSGEGRIIFSSYFFDVFRELQVPYDLKMWTAYYGVVHLVCSVGVVAVTRALNRKTAIYLWAGIMAVCMTIIIVYKFLRNRMMDVSAWVPVVFGYVYFLFSMSGLYAGIFTIISEIQVAHCRAEMTALLSASVCLFFSIYTFLFPHVIVVVSIEYVLLYCLLNLILVCAAIFVLVPETSSLEFYESATNKKKADQI